MAQRKVYADASFYEKKLSKVMSRFEIPEDDFTYNWDRFSAFIQFKYKGELYRFELNLNHVQDLSYGSDCFARLVLALEDLSRVVERGIYDLARWVAGMRYLPPAIDIPDCFKFLGFTEIPEDENEVTQRYKKLSKTYHPDNGGTQEQFIALQNSAAQAKAYFCDSGGSE